MNVRYFSGDSDDEEFDAELLKNNDCSTYSIINHLDKFVIAFRDCDKRHVLDRRFPYIMIRYLVELRRALIYKDLEENFDFFTRCIKRIPHIVKKLEDALISVRAEPLELDHPVLLLRLLGFKAYPSLKSVVIDANTTLTLILNKLSDRYSKKPEHRLNSELLLDKKFIIIDADASKKIEEAGGAVLSDNKNKVAIILNCQSKIKELEEELKISKDNLIDSLESLESRDTIISNLRKKIKRLEIKIANLQTQRSDSSPGDDPNPHSFFYNTGSPNPNVTQHDHSGLLTSTVVTNPRSIFSI